MGDAPFLDHQISLEFRVSDRSTQAIDFPFPGTNVPAQNTTIET